MLSKTIIAALLATVAVALPANTARDSATLPDYILYPKPIDRPGQPSAPTKRDPNSLVKFYIPGTEPVDDVAVTKRDPNSLVKFYIPGAPTPDGEEDAASLDKRFYIYHRPPPGAEPLDEESDAAIEKRNTVPDWILYPKPIDKPGEPSAPEKRDPNSLDTLWTPSAPADE